MRNTELEGEAIVLVSGQTGLEMFPPNTHPEIGGLSKNCQLIIPLQLKLSTVEKIEQMIRSGLHLKVTIEYF